MLLREIVTTSAAVAATPARTEKIRLLAAAIARLGADEVAAGVSFLTGEPRQRRLGVGWASLRDTPPAADEPQLSVGDVDAAFDRLAAVAGAGSQAERRRLVDGLFGRAVADEQDFLRRLMLGDLRQGALQAVVTDAVARAVDVPVKEVRRALMLLGDPGALAEIGLRDGVEGLRRVGLVVGRPVQPMLASTAPDLAAALDRIMPAAMEWKLDGARIQVHRSGGDVAVFTRSLDDVTGRVPEVVEAAQRLQADPLVLDGEAIALRPDGRPQPFQVTGSRFASRRSVEELRRTVPLTPFVFDVLHAAGDDLLDRPGEERAAVLAGIAPPDLLVPRARVDDAAAGEAFQADALARGHEGVMVKSLDEPYAAGRRGSGWIKVKPRHTLDLVVLAAEWGHGRRRGMLSNLHLGARSGDGFVMLGKTFKGLTDAVLRWQTERLLELETGREGITVHVRPELVVEIAFDGVQASPRYPGGVALRFARVLRYRDDKRADEADTLDMVLALGPVVAEPEG
jgi:DNA ligase-1